MNHTIGYCYKETSITALFYAFNYSFYKMGVPIFIMVTGVLFLSKQSDYKYIF